jgi:hypothetical protein
MNNILNHHLRSITWHHAEIITLLFIADGGIFDS